MADQPIDPRQHYVYALFREDGQTPFYIGLGTRRRWLRHEKELDGRNPHKDNIIRKMLATGTKEIPKAKLLENLTRKEVAAIEIDLIHLIRRYPSGPLVNMTRGGDGVADMPEESKRRQSAAITKRWHQDRPAMLISLNKAVAESRTPEARATRSESVKESWKKPERRAAAKKSHLSAPQKELSRQRMKSHEMRKKLNAGNARPEVREKRIAAQRLAFSTPESKLRRSIASKKRWAKTKGHQNTD